MSERYHCLTGRRHEKLIPSALNGIDFLEVGTGGASLHITFVKPDGLASLTKDRLKLTGGVRHGPPRIDGVAVSATDPKTLDITLAANQATDFSAYRLTLVAPGGATPPGFDPESASVEFSFKVECPSPFDCADDGPPESTPAGPEPDLNYLARDWAGFRELMLDRLSALLPGFADDTPVDHLVTHVEALAYVADHLSYRLDAIANETDLFRARSRISLARHARLLDYPVHEGANARVFAQIDYNGADGDVLPPGTPLAVATELDGVTLTPDRFGSVAPFAPIAFETMHPLALYAGNNRLAFHTWSGEQCILRRGATRATLRRALAPGKPDAHLGPGDFLILMETVSPDNGRAAEADRLKRHAVRLTEVSPRTDLVENIAVLEIAWDAQDALPFDLTISTEFSEGGAPAQALTCAEARGNVVLSDHGLTLPVRNLTSDFTRRALTPALLPPSAPDSGSWRPRLLKGPVVRAAPVDLDAKTGLPASTVLRNDPGSALAALTLADTFKPWIARRDLLASERFDRHFVVETEHDGTVHLRFGDNVMGQQPLPGQALTASARIGRHMDGNIGAEALSQIVTTVAGIVAVTNPLAATGGVSGVSPTRVRIEAPHAFATQERAVTEADYAGMAERHPAVASARAQVRWTGSWRTSFVYIDRVGGLPVESDARFRRELMRHMDRYRLCGIDIALKDAISVPLDLTLSVCVAPGRLRASVRRLILEQLGSGVLATGARGFFHPDNFTFGTALYVSRLVAVAMAVPGVASVDIENLVRRGKPDMGELDRGVVEPLGFEIIRLDNDPNFPENGLLTLNLKGGK